MSCLSSHCTLPFFILLTLTSNLSSLYLKDEAKDYLEVNTLRNLVRKYSQFINFPIYLWADKEVEVDQLVEEDAKVYLLYVLSLKLQFPN